MSFPPDKRYAGTRSSQKVAESSGPAPHPPLQRAIGLANRAGALTSLLSKKWRKARVLPPPRVTGLGFKASAASLYLPAFHKGIFESGDPDGIRPHDLLLERQAC